MGLRSYLIKRAALTFVTIIIVLTLMFVLFRLMPGDPVSLLVQPGLTPFERDAQRVAFGFARWEVAPGVFKLGNFRIPDVGLYNVTINAEDTAGNRIQVYAAYVHERPPPPGSPLFIHTVDLDPGLQLFEDDTLTITANVIRSNTSVPLSSIQVWALISPPGGSPTNVTLSLSPDNRFAGSFTPTTAGVFGMEIGAYNPVEGQLATVPHGFAVNPAEANIAPFRYITTEDPRGAIFTTGVSWARDVVEVYAILGSSGGNVVERFDASVTWPSRGEYLTQEVSMAHPLIAVPRPIYEEFWFYMVGILSGNFGTSFTSGRPISTEMGERIGPTLLLFGAATIISIVLGILGGVLLAWIRGSRAELTAIVTSLFFYSMPIFWFGLILLFVFAYTYTLFPLGGFGCLDSQGLPLQGVDCALDVLWHMTLPLLNLVILNLAGYVLLMRNSLMEVLGEDFIQVARAKGLKERTVMYKHAARNAMLPVTTVVALAMAGVISGGVLTETIFSWPGMGFYLVQRTLTQDFPAVQAAFFVLALLTILGNIVADVAYAYLDPRVRL